MWLEKPRTLEVNTVYNQIPLLKRRVHFFPVETPQDHINHAEVILYHVHHLVDNRQYEALKAGHRMDGKNPMESHFLVREFVYAARQFEFFTEFWANISLMMASDFGSAHFCSMVPRNHQWVERIQQHLDSEDWSRVASGAIEETATSADFQEISHSFEQYEAERTRPTPCRDQRDEYEDREEYRFALCQRVRRWECTCFTNQRTSKRESLPRALHKLFCLDERIPIHTFDPEYLSWELKSRQEIQMAPHEITMIHHGVYILLRGEIMGSITGLDQHILDHGFDIKTKNVTAGFCGELTSIAQNHSSSNLRIQKGTTVAEITFMNAPEIRLVPKPVTSFLYQSNFVAEGDLETPFVSTYADCEQHPRIETNGAPLPPQLTPRHLLPPHPRQALINKNQRPVFRPEEAMAFDQTMYNHDTMSSYHHDGVPPPWADELSEDPDKARPEDLISTLLDARQLDCPPIRVLAKASKPLIRDDELWPKRTFSPLFKNQSSYIPKSPRLLGDSMDESSDELMFEDTPEILPTPSASPHSPGTPPMNHIQRITPGPHVYEDMLSNEEASDDEDSMPPSPQYHRVDSNPPSPGPDEDHLPPEPESPPPSPRYRHQDELDHSRPSSPSPPTSADESECPEEDSNCEDANQSDCEADLFTTNEPSSKPTRTKCFGGIRRPYRT